MEAPRARLRYEGVIVYSRGTNYKHIHVNVASILLET